ncbi:MAG: hypothetical protein AB8B95_13860 [Pseudohongiellaceae bacterium]
MALIQTLSPRARFRQLLSSMLLVVFVSGCAITDLEDWPADLPEVDLFVASYNTDPVNQGYQELSVYLYWVRAFYKGNIAYPTGWSDVENIIQAESGDNPDPVFSAKLEALGVAIAAEWSKENPIRKIDNRMLAMWASILQIALTENKHRQAVDLVSKDIDDLFAGKVSGDELTDARYETALGLPLFGDF